MRFFKKSNYFLFKNPLEYFLPIHINFEFESFVYSPLKLQGLPKKFTLHLPKMLKKWNPYNLLQ